MGNTTAVVNNENADSAAFDASGLLSQVMASMGSSADMIAEGFAAVATGLEPVASLLWDCAADGTPENVKFHMGTPQPAMMQAGDSSVPAPWSQAIASGKPVVSATAMLGASLRYAGLSESGHQTVVTMPVLKSAGQCVAMAEFVFAAEAADVTAQYGRTLEAACAGFSMQAKFDEAAAEGNLTATAITNGINPVICISPDFRITHLNAASGKLVSEFRDTFEQYFPNVDLDNLAGVCIDDFHKNPAHQRKLLAENTNWPLLSEIKIGDLEFSLSVSEARNDSGDLVGYSLEWQEVGKARAVALQAARQDSMLQTCEAMFMTADLDLNITYCNPSSITMLKKYEGLLQKRFPGFDAAKLVGRNIDDFHVNPAHQRALLSDPSKLPISSTIQLGPLHFGVTAMALHDADGEFVGVGVQWNDLNDREAYRGQVNRVISAVESGDLSVRGDTEKVSEAYHDMLVGVNNVVDAFVTPLNGISDVIQALSEQDLTSRFHGDYEGGFAAIQENINSALDNMESVISQVGSSAVDVATAADTISEGASKLAEGASTQASAIEQISASLEEMTSMTHQNADNSDQARNLAANAQESAKNGQSTMSDMQDAINAIKKSSDETAAIVKTIEEIAFQTNLLALNAAVEAARAGDAGKGFAVVAEEVRSLAQRSAEAAKDTARLIDGAVKNADNGVTISARVGEILSEIFDGSSKVNDLIAEIAAASKEQADGVAQVNEAVDQMNQVTQENAANSEESSASATQMKSEVDLLAEKASMFKVSDQPAGGSGGRGASPAASESARSPKPSAPKKSSGRPSIPMDDDEFGDF